MDRSWQRGESWMIVAITMAFSLGMILFGAELFTNSVEWLGNKLNLGQGAVGSVLAAIGTALPETAVPITAILFGNSHEAHDVGIGGILGAPFLLATLGSLVMAVSLLIFRANRFSHGLQVSEQGFSRDMTVFLLAYSFAVLTGCIPVKIVHKLMPWLLVCVYILFIVLTLKDKTESSDSETLKSLYLQAKSEQPGLLPIFIQLVFALLLIVGGAHFLTSGIEKIASMIQMPAFVLSALLIPLATELPETLNSVVWIRQGKDRLALGNITGAMVFQSTLVPAVGIWMTPWNLTWEGMLTGGLTLAAATFTFGMYRVYGSLQPWMLLCASSLYWILPMHSVAIRYPDDGAVYLGFGILILSVLVLAAGTTIHRHRAV
jgi:cation:H+ antiporter